MYFEKIIRINKNTKNKNFNHVLQHVESIHNLSKNIPNRHIAAGLKKIREINLVPIKLPTTTHTHIVYCYDFYILYNEYNKLNIKP